MTEPVSEQHGNALLLEGSFNPKIFQPAWLAAQSLIREAEFESADIQILHEEVVAFTIDWARLEVRRDQLTVLSTPKSETPEQVRDLVLGMIQILDHTPVYSVALQFFAHYALKDQAERDKLGWTLVPPDPFKDNLQRPGMRTLKVLGRRPGAAEDDEDRVAVVIEPSARIRPNGVYVNVSDHYSLAEPSDSNVGAEPAIGCIEERWKDSMHRARNIATGIFSVT